jgi:hypothetical protein
MLTFILNNSEIAMSVFGTLVTIGIYLLHRSNLIDSGYEKGYEKAQEENKKAQIQVAKSNRQAAETIINGERGSGIAKLDELRKKADSGE